MFDQEKIPQTKNIGNFMLTDLTTGPVNTPATQDLCSAPIPPLSADKLKALLRQYPDSPRGSLPEPASLAKRVTSIFPAPAASARPD